MIFTSSWPLVLIKYSMLSDILMYMRKLWRFFFLTSYGDSQYAFTQLIDDLALHRLALEIPLQHAGQMMAQQLMVAHWFKANVSDYLLVLKSFF